MRSLLSSLVLIAFLSSCGAPPRNDEPADPSVQKPTKKVAQDAVPLALSDGRLHLPLPLRFATAGGTELSPECKPMLEKIKLWLDQKPDVTLLRLEVHSDAAIGDAAAQALTEARALALAKELVAAGADCKRLLPVGFGGTKPAADTTTPDGRAQNRRVELRPATLRGKAIGGMPVDGGGKVAGDPCAR